MRLALGCSVGVHAAVLGATLVALHWPLPAVKPEMQPIAVVFETLPQLRSQPENPAGADPVPTQAPPMPPLPTLPSAIETARIPEPASPIEAGVPSAAQEPQPPVAAPSTSPVAIPRSAAEMPNSPDATPMPADADVPPPPSPIPVRVPPAPSLAPGKPATPRMQPRVARSAPAVRPVSPPVSTPQPVQPSPPYLGPAQQIAPSSAAPAPPAQAQVSSGWQSALAAWMQSHRTYPDEARRRAEEGTVLVRFTVARDGHILEVIMVRSSGSPMLDEAAQATFRNARLPPFPADMAQAQTTVTVPIRYRLE